MVLTTFLEFDMDCEFTQQYLDAQYVSAQYVIQAGPLDQPENLLNNKYRNCS